jgi:hypothetical protein
MMPMTDAPLYTLYLAAPNGDPFTPAQEDTAMALVGARFPSFTVIAARDHDRAAVAALAGALAHQFGQRWVGMVDGARYTSIAATAG